MAKIVGLPKLSPTMEEGTLAKWVKKEGDTLGVDDLVAEVETDKATMEWRALDKGVLLKILVPEGTTLKPDQPVAIIGNAGEDIAALVAQAGSGAAVPAATPPSETPLPRGGRGALRVLVPRGQVLRREAASLPPRSFASSRARTTSISARSPAPARTAASSSATSTAPSTARRARPQRLRRSRPRRSRSPVAARDRSNVASR